MDNYGFITVLPLLIMLVMVIYTKKVFESMLIPLIMVFILKDGKNFIIGFVDAIYETFADETYPWILLMLTLFGGFIALLINSGGTSGFRKLAIKHIKSQKSSLIFTWVLGLLIFIDDYINNLGIGPSVRTVTDKYKVPREALGFIICSTGTPICSLVPLTAFAVFVFGVMQDTGVATKNATLLSEYIKILPFMFYPILIILISLLVVLGIAPKVGPMKKYFNSLNTNQIADTNETSDEVETEKEDSSSIIDFLVPIGVVLACMLSTSNLVLSVILGLTSCFILYVPRKKMTVDKFFSSFFEGINDMIFILIIILMTFVFVRGLNALGFSEYVIQSISPYLTGGVIPMVTFIIVGLIAFLGVDYWAVMLLISPIAIPLAAQFDVNVYMTVAAIASGSIFGGTSCLFSEQILMCSQSVNSKPVKVALTGLPYNLTAFTLTATLYLVFGSVL